MYHNLVSQTLNFWCYLFGSSNSEETKEAVSIPPSSDQNTDDDPIVIQEVRRSPEGHSVSIFKVTKSAPNTPMLKRHKIPKKPQPTLSSDSENEKNSSLSITSKKGQSQMLEKLQNTLSSSLKKEDSESSNADAFPVIVHKASVKSKSDTLRDSKKLKAKMIPKSPNSGKDSPTLKQCLKPVNTKFGEFPTTQRGYSSLKTPDKRKLQHWTSLHHATSNPNIHLKTEKNPTQTPFSGTLPRVSNELHAFVRLRNGTEKMGTTPRKENGNGSSFIRYIFSSKNKGKNRSAEKIIRCDLPL